MGSFEDEVEATRCWMESERFADTTRLYTARQVVEQRGTVLTDYPVARNAARSPPSGPTHPGKRWP